MRSRLKANLPSVIIFGVLAALSIVAARAEPNCAEIRQQCFQGCTAEHRQDSQDFSQRESELASEEARHQAELGRCRAAWSRYRSEITGKYQQQTAACTTAACRTQALNGYNLLWNGSVFHEQNCEAQAEIQHSANVSSIYARYPAINFDHHDPAYQNHKDCLRDCGDDYKHCRQEEDDGDDGSSGSAGYRIEPCPGNTAPNPLGICTAKLETQEAEATSDDGCGPGMERGPRDDCVPKIQLVGVYHDGSNWWLMCPKGTKPSPIDGGCVIDAGNTGGDDVEVLVGRQCPPGSVLGPHDQCIPVMTDLETLAEAALWTPDETDVGQEAFSLLGQVMPVTDPEQAVARSRELTSLPSGQ